MVLLHRNLALTKCVLTLVIICTLYTVFVSDMEMVHIKSEVLKHAVGKCQKSGRNDGLLKREKQTPESVHPEDMEFLQESHVREGKGTSQRGNLSPWKRFIQF